tara:strand:- start:3701 stop:4123 length:423 start_codon:yes stop_codon:yes gene_type:complete
MKKILVLCTGNSCRSQIAHGWLNYYSDSSKIKVYSAGIEAHGLNSMAIETMNEIGLDISYHKSNLISEYNNIKFDFIITVCDNASEDCPIFLSKNAKKIHHNFTDPSKTIGDIKKIENAFRNSRDEIRDFCKKFIIKNLL